MPVAFVADADVDVYDVYDDDDDEGVTLMEKDMCGGQMSLCESWMEQQLMIGCLELWMLLIISSLELTIGLALEAIGDTGVFADDVMDEELD